MVAPRWSVDMLRFRIPQYDPVQLWKDLVDKVDWQRVLIEAEGRHLRAFREDPDHRDIEKDTCGECLLATLVDWEGTDI